MKLTRNCVAREERHKHAQIYRGLGIKGVNAEKIYFG